MTSDFGIKQDRNGYMQVGKCVPNRLEIYNYDDGRRRKEALFDDVDGDGFADLHAVSLFCYDDNHYKSVANMVRFIDNDADGKADVIEYYESDFFGLTRYAYETFDDTEEKDLKSLLFDEENDAKRDMLDKYKKYGAKFED